MKIVSLLPSATEIVYHLGLGDALCGRTHECDWPPEAARAAVMTGSVLDHGGASSEEIHQQVSESQHSGISIYNLDEGKLSEADPDLVLTQELCEVCAVSYGDVSRAVRRLEGERTILSLEPADLPGILETIREVSRRAGVPERGEAVCRGLEERIGKVRETASRADRSPRVFAVEWMQPPFYGGHWIPEMIELAGGRDGLGRPAAPSSEAGWEQIAEYDPEVAVLMPCGFDTEKTLAEYRSLELPEAWRESTAVRSGEVYAVDASAYFSRPGPRIVDGLEILGEILHPEFFERRSPPDAWRKLG